MAASVLAPAGVTVRSRMRVRGVVQGVGFRPFVYHLATQLDLAGHVGNDPDGVFVEVEGDEAAVQVFATHLRTDAPPLARIDSVEADRVEPVGESGFRIVETVSGSAVATFMSPDVAVCRDCIDELFDPTDRRYRYPFINCTNCGPRFTITTRLPYDRPNTTMRGFDLCSACEAQYRDPDDRRFHAQPLACESCGPRLWFESGSARHERDDAIAACQRALAGGAIVAIKGIGGYHLACDATSDAAVARLRERKHRGDKPLAVMVGDLATAARLALIDPAEAALLQSRQRPIVLLRQRPRSILSGEVAPRNPLIGVLLPYAPIHHLLLHRVPGHDGPKVPTVLVMTSGNLSDEPICYEDDDAHARLGLIADAWLVHNRPIHVPCDDSVLRVEGGVELPIRRSRGYAPLPINLPFEVPASLAVGGELKNTFCVATGRNAWMSQHLGDMGSVETLTAFGRSLTQFVDMYEVNPTTVAADRHPGYHTRTWAEAHSPVGVEAIQHHHAHIAAVMTEHGLPPDQQVIGYAFDGTGYGSDGAIWGGEILVAGYENFERAGHLRYAPLPGGDAAVRKPYRAALAQLWAAAIPWTTDLAPVRFAAEAERNALKRQLERNVQCAPTSSMGRLFDVVSSLLGIRHVASYEAEAAIELETAAAPNIATARGYRFATDDRLASIDPGPVLRAMIEDMRAGHSTGVIAAGFHAAVATMMVDTADAVRDRTGLNLVALSGGVFQNVVLLSLARARLRARGFEVLTHRLVPANDGGLALGQIAIAARRQKTRSRA